MSKTPRQALTAADLIRPRIKKIDLADGEIHIRALSAAYAIGLRGRTLVDADIFDLLARSICTPAGEELLTAEQVGEIPLTTLQPILDQVMDFNAMSQGKAADDLKKTPV